MSRAGDSTQGYTTSWTLFLMLLVDNIILVMVFIRRAHRVSELSWIARSCIYVMSGQIPFEMEEIGKADISSPDKHGDIDVNSSS
jgi:hypothetical protein